MDSLSYLNDFKSRTVIVSQQVADLSYDFKKDCFCFVFDIYTDFLCTCDLSF